MNDNKPERLLDAERRLDAEILKLESMMDEITVSAGNFRREMDGLARTLRFMRYAAVFLCATLASLGVAAVFFYG